MEEQRSRAREAHKADGGAAVAPVEITREVLDEHGDTEFTGRQEYETTGARVLAIIAGGERVARVDSETGPVQVVCDRTPFYAESGGQVGDTGTLTTVAGTVARVTDTQYVLPGRLVAHHVEISTGSLSEGDTVDLAIDGPRRDAIRRNHTATHLLHSAMRTVLGTHVKQAGSLVAPDRLRFDFSHFEPVSADDLARIEELANLEVISDAPVRHYETTKDHAESIGAIAFFGDKYGDVVRVLEAGPASTELCGGTHVHALGFIGPIKIVSEGSIGSNLRRIEAVTGEGAIARVAEEERQLRDAASLLNTTPAEMPDRIGKLLGQVKALTDEVAASRRREAVAAAAELAASATNAVVVARKDGLGPDDLRQLAIATRDALGAGSVVMLLGVHDGKAGIVATVGKERVAAGVSAAELAGPVAKLLGGGTAKNPELVVGGGPKTDGIDEALTKAQAQVAGVIG